MEVPRASAQVTANTELLLAVAYIDGELHPRERSFVHQYFDSVIRAAEQAFDGKAADRARLREEYQTELLKLFERLHHEIAPLAPLLGDGRMGVVAGVGFPEPDRSHFAALDMWWSATPGETFRTGWLGRWLDATSGPDDVVLLVSTAREQATGWASHVCERRDSALLMMGFAGAFRRSELSGLTGADVELHPADGVHVHLRKSKTDQMGEGGVYPLPRTKDPLRCPACAFVRWAAVVSTFEDGGKDAVIRLLSGSPEFGSRHVCRSRAPKIDRRAPLFRSCRNGVLSEGPLSGAGIHAVIRRRALRAGFDPEAVERLGGHSLRAGFVTQAARAGADHHSIMRQTGHRTPAMVTRYVRESAPLIGNAVTVLGL